MNWDKELNSLIYSMVRNNLINNYHRKLKEQSVIREMTNIGKAQDSDDQLEDRRDLLISEYSNIKYTVY